MAIKTFLMQNLSLIALFLFWRYDVTKFTSEEAKYMIKIFRGKGEGVAAKSA